MRFKAVILVAGLLGACNSAAMKAEDDYEFLSGSGASKAELCAASTKAKEAWAERQNKEKYEHWKLVSDVNCLSAQIGG